MDFAESIRRTLDRMNNPSRTPEELAKLGEALVSIATARVMMAGDVDSPTPVEIEVH